MENRINFWRKPQDLAEIHELFLACEFKPHTPFWNTLENSMSDVVPAFTHGRLGVLANDPTTYSIINVSNEEEPLVGYLMTSEIYGICLLDKIKGFNGLNAFNFHYRTLCHAFTEVNKVVTAWCYVVSPHVLTAYKQIQQISMGFWDNEDKDQKQLLDTLV